MRHSDDKIVTAIHCVLGALGAGMILSTCWVGDAGAHKSPLAWEYPTRCCWGPASGRTGDCAMIDASTVKEGPDGYHVTLKPGDHPLVTKETISFVVPYSEAEDAPDGAFHVCLIPSTLKPRCFFAGAKGF